MMTSPEMNVTAASWWPEQSVPELLARLETLLDVRRLCTVGDPVDRHVSALLNRHGRTLAELETRGLLAGETRARFLRVIAASRRPVRIATSH